MPTVYPIYENYNTASNGNNSNTTINGGYNTFASIDANKIIQSYGLRFVSQDQIDRWESLYKSIEQNNGVNYKWHQTIKITEDIVNNNNLITLPNNKFFYDYDSKSLVVFVNNNYISPSRYIITNKQQFYFKNGVIKPDDMVDIIHMNKENDINNYDTRFMAIATSWQYTYTNDTENYITSVTLPSNLAFMNEDKYALLVHVNGLYVSPNVYEIENVHTLKFTNKIIAPNDNITLIQLSRVLPNNEYIGYMWGESIKAPTSKKVFTLSEDHAFSSLQDRSALVFLDGKITKDYSIANTNTIEFNKIIQEGTSIEIIQLGYTADISKLKEIIDIDSFEKYFNINLSNLVSEETRDKPLGFVGINAEGFINNNLLNIDELTELIKNKLIEQGWTPGTGSGSDPSNPDSGDDVESNHQHDNYEVLAMLQYENDKLYVNGYPVGERAIEIEYSVNVTDTIISNYGFELPEDCDPDRPINVVINSAFTIVDTDWRLVINDLPLKDKIYWKNMLLENIVEVGDIIFVTYYKKVDKITPPVIEDDGTNPAHIHNNKDLLDMLSIDVNNNLCINGTPVGESSIEVSYDVVIDDIMLTNKAIELPYDCDTNRSLTVVLENLPQMFGHDYIVTPYTFPERDKISWENFGMDGLVEKGDRISINYYRKLL